jgi:hypothetical protein
MSLPALIPTPAAAAGSPSPYTITAMSRWSILSKDLPPVSQIRTIHVYDFDNTLFRTPTPNSALWTSSSVGTLSTEDAFACGGWWHDARILAATGSGLDEEEARGWAGWWNETVLELVRLSIRQKDALTVLLTGRGENNYRELIKRMVRSQDLELDIIGLKPSVGPANERFSSTMKFKQAFLTALAETYKGATELKIYEDRVNHVRGFREFFADYNKKLSAGMLQGAGRGPITADVIHVVEATTNLDPVVEVAHVQRMVAEHNAAVSLALATPRANKMSGNRLSRRKHRVAVHKTITGYMLTTSDSEKLLALAADFMRAGTSGPGNSDVRLLATNIVITPHAAPAHILDKVGGLNAKMRWEVTGLGVWKDTIWAARVKPVPAGAAHHVDSHVPVVVLAQKRFAKPMDANRISSWIRPPGEPLILETTVKENAILRIEAEGEDEGVVVASTAGIKRKFSGMDASPYKEAHHNQHQHHHNHHDNNSSRGRGSPYRGNRGNPNSNNNNHGGGGRGGGRGGGAGGNHTPRGGGTPKGPFKSHRGGGSGNRGGGGRGRGGGGGAPYGYRSLDDVGQGGGDGGAGIEGYY